MAIDFTGLPLAIAPPSAAELRRRAEARANATRAWLDQDELGLGRLIDTMPEFNADFGDLQATLNRRNAPERARAAPLADLLSRLAQSAGGSDDPDLRERHGALARGLVADHVAGGLIHPAAADELTRDYEGRLSRADAERLTREDPALARKLLNDLGLFAALPEDARATFQREAEARLSEGRKAGGAAQAGADAQAQIARFEQAAAARTRLARLIDAGDLKPDDIAAAEARGEIDSAGAAWLHSRLDGARFEADLQARRIAKVEKALGGGKSLDPNSLADRAAVEIHYKKLVQAWDAGGLNPEEVRRETARYVAKTRIVPEAVRQDLILAMRSGAPAEQVRAAQLMDVMREADPRLASQPMQAASDRDQENEVNGLASPRADEKDRQTLSEEAIADRLEGGATGGSGASPSVSTSIPVDDQDTGSIPDAAIAETKTEPMAAFEDARLRYDAIRSQLPEEDRRAFDEAFSDLETVLRNETPDVRAQLEKFLREGKAEVAFVDGVSLTIGMLLALIVAAAISEQSSRNGRSKRQPGALDRLANRLTAGTPTTSDPDDWRPSATPVVDVLGASAPVEPWNRGSQGDFGAKIFGNLVFAIAQQTAREDKRGGPRTVAANKKFAEICSNYAKKAYPNMPIKHVAGTYEEGVGRYLKEKNIKVTKLDGSESFRRGDILYAAKIGAGTYTVLYNSVTMTKGGIPISIERKALRDLATAALAAIAWFGKPGPDESDKDFEERALKACKQGLEKAYGPPKD